MSDSVAIKKVNPAAFIDKCGMTKFAVGQLILVMLCGLFEGMDYMLVSYTMAQISAEWGLNSVATGSLSSWAMIGCVIGGLIGGGISDKIGRKKAMIFSVFLFSIFTIPIAFSTGFIMFAICRVIAGIAIGSALALTVAMAAELAPTNKRTLITGISCGATPLGYVAASAVAMLMVPAFGWRSVYFVATIGLPLCLVLIPLLLDSPFWCISNNKPELACKFLNKVRISAGIDHPEITPEMLDIQIAPKSKQKKASYALLFSTKKLAIATIGASLIYFFAMFTLYGINSWYPTLMLERGLGVTKAYGFSLAMNAAGIVGNVVAGALLQALGRKKGEIFGFALAFVFVLIMAWVNGGAAILVIEALLVGFAINYLPPSVNAMTPELFPTNARGSGVSFVMSVGRFAGMLSPIVAGMLIGAGLNYSGLISCFEVSAIIGLALVLIFVRSENADKTLAEIEES